MSQPPTGSVPTPGEPTPQNPTEVFGAQQPPFGATDPNATAQQPAFGQQAQPQYGQPAQPDFGQQAQPQYGQPAQPDFGQQAQPQYGQPAQPDFGQQAQPQYGQPAQPAFGQPAQPSYGGSYGSAPSQAGYGAAPTVGAGQGGFGVPNQPGYGGQGGYGGQPPSGGNRNKIIIGAIVGVLVIALIAVVAARFLGGGNDPDPTGGPTDDQTTQPTDQPTDEPTDQPTDEPTTDSGGDSASCGELCTATSGELDDVIVTGEGTAWALDGEWTTGDAVDGAIDTGTGTYTSPLGEATLSVASFSDVDAASAYALSIAPDLGEQISDPSNVWRDDSADRGLGVLTAYRTDTVETLVWYDNLGVVCVLSGPVADESALLGDSDPIYQFYFSLPPI